MGFSSRRGRLPGWRNVPIFSSTSRGRSAGRKSWITPEISSLMKSCSRLSNRFRRRDSGREGRSGSAMRRKPWDLLCRSPPYKGVAVFYGPPGGWPLHGPRQHASGEAADGGHWPHRGDAGRKKGETTGLGPGRARRRDRSSTSFEDLPRCQEARWVWVIHRIQGIILLLFSLFIEAPVP